MSFKSDAGSSVNLTAPRLDHLSLTTQMSTEAQTLGTLSVLSRELREEIYNAVLIGINEDLSFNDYPPHPHPDWNLPPQSPSKWLPDNFGILQTSWTIRREALSVLSTYGKFYINCKQFYENGCNEYPYLNDISNVKFSFDVEVQTEIRSHPIPIGREMYHWGPSFQSIQSVKPLLFFAGTDILRKSCTIVLNGCTYSFSLLDPPLHEAISRLTGFQTVTLEFFKKEKSVHRMISLPPTWDSTATVKRVRGQLAPALGPGIICKLQPKNVDDDGAQSVTFHPQDFLAQTRMRERDHVDETASEIITLHVAI